MREIFRRISKRKGSSKKLLSTFIFFSMGIVMSSIEKVKDDLHKALDNAEQTRERTRSSEDRDFVMLIRGAKEFALTIERGDAGIVAKEWK